MRVEGTRSGGVPLLNRLPWTRIKLSAVKVVYRLLRPVLGRKPRLIVRHPLPRGLSEAIDFALFVAGNFQGHVTKSGLLSVPPDAVIFDVGANLGSMTLAFARQAPRGRVVAFEPTHSGFAIVKSVGRLLRLAPLHAAVILVYGFGALRGAWIAWKRGLGSRHSRVFRQLSLGAFM